MRSIKILLFIITIAGLSACGIKPKELTAPDASDADPTVFPRTYPDPTL